MLTAQRSGVELPQRLEPAAVVRDAVGAAASEHPLAGPRVEHAAVVPLRRFAHPDPFAEANVSCAPPPPLASLGAPRPLAWVAPPGPNGPPEEWPVNCFGREPLCAVLRKVAVNREVMVAVANSAAPGLQPFLDSIAALNIPNFLVVAIDQQLADRLASAGVAHYYVPNAAQGNHKVSAQKFSLLKAFVSVGCSVLLTDTDVLYLSNPFAALHRDSDVESMSDGWDAGSSFGWLDGLDDATGPAGPLRRGATLRIAALNSGLWFVTATAPTLALMAVMEHRMATEDLWDQSGYNMELLLPSHDAHLAARASVRVMSPLCFVNSKVLFRIMRFHTHMLPPHHTPVAVHVNYHADKQAKMALAAAFYLRGDAEALDRCVGDGCAPDPGGVADLEASHKGAINDGFVASRGWGTAGPAALRAGGCAPLPPWGGAFNTSPVAYPLQGVIPLAAPGACAPGLAALCSAVGAALAAAPSCPGVRPRELLLSVAHGADAGALPTLLASLEASSVARCSVVLLLDDAPDPPPTSAAVVRLLPDSPLRVDAGGGSLPGGAVKWGVASSLLRSGLSLLLVDPPTVFFSSPFVSLYRDCDVEAATHGWDEASAWGYDHVVDDPLMGWSRYCHGARVSTRDPGLAWVAATRGGAALAARTAAHIAGDAQAQEEGGGYAASQLERTAFNAHAWLPAHGAYFSAGVGTRAMNFLCFANDKAFLTHAKRDAAFAGFTPVGVRLSYSPHPEGVASGLWDQYGPKKEAGAVDRALAAAGAKVARPPGCGAGGGAHPLTPVERASSPLAAFAAASHWSWGGMQPFTLAATGAVATPWGPGEWGLAGEGALFAKFAGAHHVLNFQPDAGHPFGMFISTRCADGEQVIGRMVPKPAGA